MSRLSALIEAPLRGEEGVKRRWITVLLEDHTNGEPAFEVEADFLPPEDLEKMKRPYMKGGIASLINLYRNMQQKDRESLFKAIVRRVIVGLYPDQKMSEAPEKKGWKGLTRGNLRRISQKALQNPSLVDALPEEIEYSPAMALDLALIIDADVIQIIENSASDLDGFAQATAEKKDEKTIDDVETSSSDSAPAD